MRRRYFSASAWHSPHVLKATRSCFSAEIADVLLRWRRFLEFYDHRETRIRAAAQFVFADVVDGHPQAFLELPCPVMRRMHAARALICLEERFGSQLVEYERNMVRARHGEEQSAGLWRIEMANAHAQAAAEQEAAVARCRFLAAAALDNAHAHAENRCERLEEGFVRERDRAAVAELVPADLGESCCGKSRPWSPNFKTRHLVCRPRLMSL